MSRRNAIKSNNLSIADALRQAVGLLQSNRPAEAARLCRAVLKAAPKSFDALQYLGIALAQTGSLAEATAVLKKALKIRPNSPALHNNLGNALRELKRYEEARSSLEKALELQPNFADALNNLGIALTCLNHRSEAVACFEKALALSPDLVDAHSNLGTVLSDLERYEEAAACFGRALELRPGFPEAYVSLGGALGKVGHHEEAIASYENALRFRPGYASAVLGIARERRQICDWRDFAAATRELRAWVGSEKEPIQPFFFLTVSDDPAEQLQCSRRFAQKAFGHLTPLPPLRATAASGTAPIRIAYVSNSFHQHAMSLLAAELFERHDRTRFEIHAFSVGPSKQDAMRARLVAAFDHFHDVRERSDREVAELIRELRCPIAVDLMGYELDARPGILAYRPAPIQVAYLQHPGPMGADFIDYALADGYVAPADQQRFYPEKLVALPNCYQVNPTEREIAPTVPSRQACGLPDQGFVLCSFNNSKKITPEVFDVWMQILAETPGSVLWLYGDNDAAERNLRREAEARGVVAGAPGLCCARRPIRAPGAAPAGRPLSGYLPVQRPHHGERRLTGRAAARDPFRKGLRLAGRRKPAQGRWPAGAHHRQPGRIPGPGHQAGAGAAAARRLSPATGREPRDLAALRLRALHAESGGRLQGDGGQVESRPAAAALYRFRRRPEPSGARPDPVRMCPRWRIARDITPSRRLALGGRTARPRLTPNRSGKPGGEPSRQIPAATLSPCVETLCPARNIGRILLAAPGSLRRIAGLARRRPPGKWISRDCFFFASEIDGSRPVC